MPQSRRYRRDDGLPATLQRSCVEAQEAFTRAYNEAVRAYGEGDQAYRAAFTALKQKFEKRDDPGVSPKTDERSWSIGMQLPCRSGS